MQADWSLDQLLGSIGPASTMVRPDDGRYDGENEVLHALNPAQGDTKGSYPPPTRLVDTWDKGHLGRA